MKLLRPLFCAALLALSDGTALATGQPSVNLGFTSFVDGAPPAGPGHYLSEYLQYYSADRINDADGDKLFDASVDVTVLMTQYIYQSAQPLLGGQWGVNVMLPLVSFDSEAPLSDNGTGLGDLLVGPFVQWGPIMGAQGPLMLNRVELQTILPTGEYDENKALNQGSNHYSFNPYWAATVFPAPKTEISWRLHYLWNGSNDDFAAGKLKPGQAVHANFAASYEVLPKRLRLGINGYYFDQITDTEINGIDVSGVSEKVFGIGPGALWSFSPDAHLFFNYYHETLAESRPQGERYNLRFVYHF